MAIYRLLQRSAFTPEHIAVITAAYEDVRRDLDLADRDDPLCQIVAKAIIDCAQKGERDLIRLRECAHEALRT
jgi:hypothetical protein